jgi:signal transduction histidine kinase
LMELESVKSGEKTWKEALPAMEQKLQYIVNQSMDAGNMIEAIRELFTSAVPFEIVDLRQIVDEALAANKDLLERSGVSSHVHLPTDLPEIPGRPKQLEIVFINLIKNAVEAMSELPAGHKREINIGGEANQAHVLIRVKDTGPGIRPDDVGKIFHPRHSTKGQKGTGLGLYLSYQIIQSHNATIEVSSQIGQGTTFTIRFPRGTR